MAFVMSIAEPKARRKDPAERRAEIVSAASRIAVTEGLERVTAKRVAEQLGVVPGLVNHYFTAVDDLVAAAFGFATQLERAEIYRLASLAGSPLEQLRRLLGELLDPKRDAVSLLWLDAWQASRRRPALLAEVGNQMDADALALSGLIEAGVAARQFVSPDPSESAVRIMALVDGYGVQAAARSRLDSSIVAEFALRATETELGITPLALTS
jgi:AcrR family transcriptional regulator